MSQVKDLYKDYPRNQEHMERYIHYQKNYEHHIRRSDQVILDIVAERMAADRRRLEEITLLDIGCSTGNLLRHVSNRFPGMNCVGGEAAPAALEACRSDPTLAHIAFAEMDILNLGTEPAYDFVTVNAVLYGFDDDDFESALKSIARVLKPGGWLIAFDFFHPFDNQAVTIVERSDAFPQGHPLNLRPIAPTRERLTAADFVDIEFRPFEIEVDLPFEGHHSIRSHTITTADGRRLLFRGTIFQPWCHLVARRAR